LVRRLFVAALAFVAITAALSSAAAGSPDGRNECEAATRVAGGKWVCVGTLPSSQRRVVLKSRNGSSERGVASVTFGIHQTKVAIRLSGAPFGATQPALIRRGGCLGRVIARLGSVANGTSVAKAKPLTHRSGLAIAVLASTAKEAALVACGVIPHHQRTP
jgi:hypothetical protein